MRHGGGARSASAAFSAQNTSENEYRQRRLSVTEKSRKKRFAERSLWAAQPHEGASKPVVNTCLCQSFRKPVRPFARHVLNIRRGRKNSLLVSQFLAYAITGRYSSFFASKFQMILAVLLARATAAICLPRRVATP